MSSPGKGYLPGGASAREWPPLFSKWSVSLLPVEVGGKVPLDCPHLPELPILQNHQGDLVFKLDLLEDIGVGPTSKQRQLQKWIFDALMNKLLLKGVKNTVDAKQIPGIIQFDSIGIMQLTINSDIISLNNDVWYLF